MTSHVETNVCLFSNVVLRPARTFTANFFWGFRVVTQSSALQSQERKNFQSVFLFSASSHCLWFVFRSGSRFSLTCRSKAWLSSELQHFLPCQLYERNRFRTKCFRSQHRVICFKCSLITALGYVGGFELVVEVGGVKISSSIGSCKETFSQSVCYFSVVKTTVHSIEMRFSSVSKGLTL